MKRIIIIDSDVAFTKELSSFFSESIEYRIVGIATDGDSALNLINELDPDVIILDLILPKTDSLSILKRYGENKKVIAVSYLNNVTLISKAIDQGVDFFMLKPLSFLCLKEHIDELFTEQIKCQALPLCSGDLKDSLNKKITNIFIQIGIPAHIKGYLFLKEAIGITIANPQIVNSITKKLYPEIASRFDTNDCRVERSIRHAIKVAWDRGKLINLNTIFGIHVYNNNEKPSNGEFIALLADRLLLENSNNI